MRKKKSAYLGYSEEEVVRMEANYYCLVMGIDFVQKDRFYVFDKKEISRLYKSTLKQLMAVVVDGSEKEKAHALDLIIKLNIQPVRLH